MTYAKFCPNHKFLSLLLKVWQLGNRTKTQGKLLWSHFDIQYASWLNWQTDEADWENWANYSQERAVWLSSCEEVTKLVLGRCHIIILLSFLKIVSHVLYKWARTCLHIHLTKYASQSTLTLPPFPPHISYTHSVWKYGGNHLQSTCMKLSRNVV